jgi:hypothetical protein
MKHIHDVKDVEKKKEKKSKTLNAADEPSTS